MSGSPSISWQQPYCLCVFYFIFFKADLPGVLNFKPVFSTNAYRRPLHFFYSRQTKREGWVGVRSYAWLTRLCFATLSCSLLRLGLSLVPWSWTPSRDVCRGGKRCTSNRWPKFPSHSLNQQPTPFSSDDHTQGPVEKREEERSVE